MSDQPPVTIKRDLGILPADKRVVFTRYTPRHAAQLKIAIKNNQPNNPNEIADCIERIQAEMQTHDILMMVDTRFMLFDTLWDNLNLNQKDNNDEHNDSDRPNQPEHQQASVSPVGAS